MALKEVALRAEFRKKELEERRSRSGTASLNSSRRSGNSKAVGMKTGRERIDFPTEIAHSASAIGERKNQPELPPINDVTKAVNFRKERDVNRGAANEAVMRNKYYNKGDTCPSFSFNAPLNNCVNDLCNLQYPRGRVGVDKDQSCQHTSTEEQHGVTVEPPIRAKKVTSPHANYSQYSQSSMRSSSNQQDSFFEYQNCKLFFDKATLKDTMAQICCLFSLKLGLMHLWTSALLKIHI